MNKIWLCKFIPSQGLSSMSSCKTTPWCESQNHTTFTPNIELLLRKTLSSCFVPKYLRVPFLKKYFVNWFFFCPELILNFIFFTFTLGHSYTYNKCKFTFKTFHKIVYMVNIFHLTPVTRTTVFWVEQFAFPCNVFCLLPNFSWRSSEHEQKPKQAD